MINEGPLSQFQALSQGLVKPIYSDYALGADSRRKRFGQLVEFSA